MDNQMQDFVFEIPDAERFLDSAETCFFKNYDNFLSGFFSRFQDSFFYANVMQCLIVTLMYMNMGKGKYWKILFYAALAGLLGSVLENGSVAYICRESERKREYKVPTFLFAEIFWISCEYAIPLLNLIKMRAFSKEKISKYINYFIVGLFIPFTICRFLIGFERMNKGYLQNQKIKSLHGFAFGIMAIADITCTIAIIYFINLHNRKNNEPLAAAISNHVKQSSYTILIAVDITGFLLSSFDLITNIRGIPSSVTVPFHCLKSSFVLILATDNLLFKYGACKTSKSLLLSNGGAQFKYHGHGNDTVTGHGNDTTTTKSGNFKSTISINNNYSYSCSIDMGNNNNNEPASAANSITKPPPATLSNHSSKSVTSTTGKSELLFKGASALKKSDSTPTPNPTNGGLKNTNLMHNNSSPNIAHSNSPKVPFCNSPKISTSNSPKVPFSTSPNVSNSNSSKISNSNSPKVPFCTSPNISNSNSPKVPFCTSPNISNSNSPKVPHNNLPLIAGYGSSPNISAYNNSPYSHSSNSVAYGSSPNISATPKNMAKNFSYGIGIRASPTVHSNDSDKTILPQYSDSIKLTTTPVIKSPSINKSIISNQSNSNTTNNKSHRKNSSIQINNLIQTLSHFNSSPNMSATKISATQNNVARNFSYDIKTSPTVYSVESDKIALTGNDGIPKF